MTYEDFAPREEPLTQEIPEEERFRNLVAEAGIDTDPTRTHHIQYVFGLPAEYNLDDYPTFEQFYAEQSEQSLLSDPYPAVSTYNGSYTPTEITQLRGSLEGVWHDEQGFYFPNPDSIKAYTTPPDPSSIYDKRMSPDAMLDVIRTKQPEGKPLTPAVEQKLLDLFTDTSFPRSGAHIYAMNHLIAEDSALTPISVIYHYGGDMPAKEKVPYEIKPNQKVAYWIDGIYGGTITQQELRVRQDRSLGSIDEVSTQLTVRSEPATKWDWEYSGYAIPGDYKVDAAPDDYLRGTVLQENIGQVHVNSGGFVEDTLREPYALQYPEVSAHPDAAIAPYAAIRQGVDRLRYNASTPHHSPHPEIDISQLLSVLKLTGQSWEDYGTTQSEMDMLARMSYRQGAIHQLQNTERFYADESYQGLYPLREQVLKLLRKGAATPAHISTTREEINKLDARVNQHRGDNTLRGFQSFMAIRRHTSPVEVQLRTFDHYAAHLRQLGERFSPKDRPRPYGISEDDLTAKRKAIENTPAPLKGLARVLGSIGLGRQTKNL